MSRLFQLLRSLATVSHVHAWKLWSLIIPTSYSADRIECFSHIVPSHGNISLCTPTFLTDHVMYQQVIYSLLLFVLSPLCSFICNPCLSKWRCRSIGRSSKHDVNHLYRVLMHIIGLFSLGNTPPFQNKGLLFPQWTTLENPFLLLETTCLSDALILLLSSSSSSSSISNGCILTWHQQQPAMAYGQGPFGSFLRLQLSNTFFLEFFLFLTRLFSVTIKSW